MNEIKNLEKGAERIIKAVKEKEKIILFSDSDLDGVVSAIVMKETINNIKGNIVDIYFPDREKEGYGISRKVLENVKEHSPALLVITDMGVGNVEEAKIAKEMGFDLIIIDHHEVLDEVPSPSITIDPKQKGDQYPFKEFAAAGLAFLVSKEILKEKMGESLEKSFIEIVSMATIADMMPIKEDNLSIVSKGISTIEKTWRPGLISLLEIEDSESLNIMDRIVRINALLNIRDGEKIPLAFKILTSSSKEESDNLVEDLIERNFRKKEEIEDMKEEIEEKIKEGSIIFEGSPHWKNNLLGSVAGFLSNKYNRPVFLYKEGEECMGSIRSISGSNVVEAMKGASHLLITYGGHPKAAGFRLKKENIKEFKEYLLNYFKR